MSLRIFCGKWTYKEFPFFPYYPYIFGLLYSVESSWLYSINWMLQLVKNDSVLSRYLLNHFKEARVRRCACPWARDPQPGKPWTVNSIGIWYRLALEVEFRTLSPLILSVTSQPFQELFLYLLVPNMFLKLQVGMDSQETNTALVIFYFLTRSFFFLSKAVNDMSHIHGNSSVLFLPTVPYLYFR